MNARILFHDNEEEIIEDIERIDVDMIRQMLNISSMRYDNWRMIRFSDIEDVIINCGDEII